MTKVALSLASLSHPNAKYHPRRSPRERKGRAWAREHAYAYDQTATVDISGFSGSAHPEMAVLATLQRQLMEGQIERGTVLILDDFGSMGEPSMRKAVSLIMSLVSSGMHVVTMRDERVWDEVAMNDLGGFLMSLILDYADNLRGQYMSARLRASLRRKKELAAKESTE
jgi:hypothetical protein